MPKENSYLSISWWILVSILTIVSLSACQKASSEMIKRGTKGSLVCISSVHSYRASKNWTPYGIAKMGIRRMVKGLAADLANTGINSNCIAPGAINNTIPEDEKVEPEAMNMPWVASGRQGLPSDISNAVIFLSSKMGEYVNGETILVDGGMIATGPLGRPDEK